MIPKSIRRCVSIAATILIASTGMAGGTASAGEEQAESLAQYNGRTINLAESWQGAEACLISDANICFDSEAELDAYLDKRESAAAASGPYALLAACSSPVRLWDGLSKTGQSITLDQRGSILSLATWGFANRAESYSVGACSSIFRDGGSVYPGSTTAWSSANTMGSWNNTIDTIYIA